MDEGQYTTPEARGSQHMLRQEDLLILEELLGRVVHEPFPKQSKACGCKMSPCSTHDISGTTLLLT